MQFNGSSNSRSTIQNRDIVAGTGIEQTNMDLQKSYPSFSVDRSQRGTL